MTKTRGRSLSIFDRIKIFFGGKKYVFLGGHAVGKTHLWTFMTTGTIPPKYTATLRPIPTPPVHVVLPDPSSTVKDRKVDIYMKGTLDVSGRVEDQANIWSQQVQKCNFLLYLFRVDKIGDPHHVKEIRTHADLISGWIAGRKTPPRLLLVGTHCDRDPKYPGRDNESRFIDYYNRVVNTEGIQRARFKLGEVYPDLPDVIIGHMKDLPHTEELAYRVMRALQ